MKIADIDFDVLWNNKDPKIYELVIEADTNDADYVTSTTPVSEMQIVAVKLFAEMIKACPKHYNWANSEYTDSNEHPLEVYSELTEQAFEWFNDLLPYGEHGIHTIVSIEYYPLPLNKIKLI
jgi:hypothetical protein